MARGITEAQVHAAADAIVIAGERPTVERIRAHLGSGSPNTVTKLLDNWWTGLGQRLAALAPTVAIPDAPAAVQRLAGELWTQAVATAREQAQLALALEHEALERARAVLAAEQIQGSELIAEAAQARAASDQARSLAEARLAEAQRRADQLETQLADATEQRTALAERLGRLEQERSRLDHQLQAERASASQEREAQIAHSRAVEDRAHAEVDRSRQEVLELRAQLRDVERDRDLERERLAKALKQAKADLSTAQRDLAKQTGRAEALEAQLAQRTARSMRKASGNATPVKAERQLRRAKRTIDSEG
ncbi:DNA-binding protein [Thermomonas fusca]|uniref:DNA-binding protein n=1 Tax=Thermomonas fusca TaxID=215690 RepID=A0A5R9PFV3_9GAMM|nr:DNA-binding protein [Thermomonas fusca]TLX22401.1 DNA-binding protein [Thermomonas fusca]